MKKWIVTLYAVATWRGKESPTVKGLMFDFEQIEGQYIVTDEVKNAFPINDFVTGPYTA